MHVAVQGWYNEGTDIGGARGANPVYGRLNSWMCGDEGGGLANRGRRAGVV